MHQLTEELASTQPDALAVCAWDEELAYGELDQLATRLMHRLMAEGVGPELLVPLCFEKSRVVRRDARCAQGRRRLRAAGPGSFLKQNHLESVARELIKICDGLDLKGLVDYSMGILEEEILFVSTTLSVLSSYF
jgi:non-ribosomal peptide synthetase component F